MHDTSKALQHPVSRRQTLLGLSALAGLTGLSLGGLKPAQAAGGNLVVSNWGGDWNDRTVRFVEAPLLESQGVRITRDLGMEAERKAKMLAERRLRRGSVDVLHLNQADAYDMFKQDILADIDQSKIANFSDVPDALKASPYFVPWLYSGVVLIYNKDKIAQPPQSYADLWDAKWAGKIGLTNQLFFNYMMMAGLINDGHMTNVDAGKERLLELKQKTAPRIYATHQHLQAALLAGEIDVAVNYKARGLQWIHDGAPLAIQYPREGAIAVMFGTCLPKRAPNPEQAYQYFEAMLDRKAMAELAEASFYAPANSASHLPDDLRQKIDFSADEQTALKFPDYDYVAHNTAEWLEWWSKNIAV
ncbi:ABC transporter substrate-binding protein [Pseudochrobactrum asaccharolyticum]|uniref:Putative spermidine/putrescine transport system substrate-binding protein n=1 Tax=Pseudochrobactrum asaccharolyticum TaxID=354351 RepID=A0A366E4K2_9HYPH|nr:extracellular solute-binding protein [Pseudochrobactrum asaccharolyticum]MBX8802019.1 extracellular solute-binding protein [Ochrobactrum sp. MR28]MBX8817697.1 extracellular solute-binding protein [Ochrobactrum sp. MR31]RBO97242.1 putative spermidine/putrescine transport system substrate-binding protein [Pseudochrobactrum asaccharolyticum]